MYHINVENERQPNFIVRCLYSVFNWIADFGPLFSSLFSFLGRSSLVLVNLLILVGTIVLSAAHSLELLRYAGLKYGLEWVGVAVWELAFIFCSIILANDFRRGNWRSGWAPWTGFLMGFAFVEASNIMGMADNFFGWAIGICTPIFLLVSKGLLAHQFKTRKKNQPTHQPTTSQNDRVNQPKFDQQETKKLVNPSTKIMIENVVETEPRIAEENTTELIAEPTEIVIGELVVNPVEQQQEETTPEADGSMEESDSLPTENDQESIEKMVVDSSETVVTELVENVVGNVVEDTAENDGQNDQMINQETNQTTDQKITEEVVETPTKKTTKRKKQLTRKRTNSSTEKMKKEARKWSLEYYRQNGELPGRLKVEKGVGCSQSVARKALDELKEELGIKAS